MIKILDCTLRDGGYLNDWSFQMDNQLGIVNGLNRSNVDYVEFGWLKLSENNDNKTFFYNNIEINEFINSCRHNQLKSLLMLDINQYSKELIDAVTNERLYGIRVAFYESSIDKLENVIMHLNQKGFKVFLQPMNTIGYTKRSLDKLFEMANELDVECVSIVDSFGSIHPSNLVSLYTTFKSKLKKEIAIGLHLHDNIGMALSNLLTIIKEFPQDDIIVDSTILGIGRGGGNIKTELISIILNQYYDFKKYDIINLLTIGWNFLSDIDNKFDLIGKAKIIMTGYFGVHPYYGDFINEETLDSNYIKFFFDSIEDVEDYRSFDPSQTTGRPQK
jgi:4-hydroxy 2-oxovalerate aldolase